MAAATCGMKYIDKIVVICRTLKKSWLGKHNITGELRARIFPQLTVTYYTTNISRYLDDFDKI